MGTPLAYFWKYDPFRRHRLDGYYIIPFWNERLSGQMLWVTTITHRLLRARAILTSCEYKHIIRRQRNDTRTESGEMIVVLPQSLEDFRQNAFQTVDEFAARLGVSTGTYYRLLKGTADITTKRRVAARLGVPPGVIAEFVPNPSQAYQDALHAAVLRANQTGWLEGDPETGLPTGIRVADTWFHAESDHESGT